VDGYQVDFRLPAGIPAGTASLQLTAAWIPGAAVAITTKLRPNLKEEKIGSIR
jgi:hypothetical protein